MSVFTIMETSYTQFFTTLFYHPGATDFTSGTYTYTILPNQQETTVSIPITDYQTVEQLREQFSISLSVQPQPGLNLGNSEASVTIVDDDGMPKIVLVY